MKTLAIQKQHVFMPSIDLLPCPVTEMWISSTKKPKINQSKGNGTQI